MKKLTLLFAITFIAIGVNAQEQGRYIEDSEIRAHFNLEKSLGKRASLFFDQQYRFTNNISTFTRGSLEAGLTFKLTNNIRLLGSYRYIQSQNNSGFWRQ